MLPGTNLSTMFADSFPHRELHNGPFMSLLTLVAGAVFMWDSGPPAWYHMYALRVHQSLYKLVLRPLVLDGASGSALE